MGHGTCGHNIIQFTAPVLRGRSNDTFYLVNKHHSLTFGTHKHDIVIHHWQCNTLTAPVSRGRSNDTFYLVNKHHSLTFGTLDFVTLGTWDMRLCDTWDMGHETHRHNIIIHHWQHNTIHCTGVTRTF